MKKIMFHVHLMLLAFFLATTCMASEKAAKLNGYKASPNDTSVSGLSSGAFMTAQLHVAYSDVFQKGAGIIAGGPYFCVGCYESDPSKFVFQATSTCMSPITEKSAPDGRKLFKMAQNLAEQKKIAGLENLKDDRLYIFSGSNDKTVKTWVVNQVQEFYKAAGVPESNIVYNKNVNAGHAIIVDEAGTPCPNTASPYINDCDFEQSSKILEQIYGKLNPPSPKGELSGKIIKFDQSEFVTSGKTSMDQDAYVYVPKDCENGGCKVHVVIHGCEQGAKVIGDLYYAHTGYNEMADTNKMIILYPQAKPCETIPFNPQGCWDFWGYSSEDPSNPVFYVRESPQMKAIVSMVKRLQK